MRFEIFLELQGFVLFRKGTIPLEFPRHIFGGVRRPAFIVIFEALLQIRCGPCVVLIWTGKTSDDVNIPHIVPTSPASLFELRRARFAPKVYFVAAPRVAFWGEAWCPEEDSNLHDVTR